MTSTTSQQGAVGDAQAVRRTRRGNQLTKSPDEVTTTIGERVVVVAGGAPLDNSTNSALSTRRSPGTSELTTSDSFRESAGPGSSAIVAAVRSSQCAAAGRAPARSHGRIPVPVPAVRLGRFLFRPSGLRGCRGAADTRRLRRRLPQRPKPSMLPQRESRIRALRLLL